MWIYNLSLFLASPFLLLLLLVRLLGDPAYRRGLSERLGRVPEQLTGGEPIWIHAVSVGEVRAAAPLIRALKERIPGAKVVLSTVTATGRGVAGTLIPEADALFYLPFDLPGIPRRVVRKIRPRAVILVETELWPNLMAALAAERIPLILVNGRISERSFPRYLRFSFFFRRLIAKFDLCLMQSDRDLSRIVALGADPARCRRTGNMKLDDAVRLANGRGRESAHLLLRLPSSGDPEPLRLIVAGSTHPGEEEIVLLAFRALEPKKRRLVLLLAPRHPNRFDEVARTIASLGFPLHRRSLLAGDRIVPGAVILLDTLGELAGLYPAADAVFIGGTFRPIGGHSLAEPAAAGKVILYGPHIENFEEIARELEHRGCAVRVPSPELLAEALKKVLDDPLLAAKGEEGVRFVREHAGAVRENVREILNVL